jgi:hypothetical protein
VVERVEIEQRLLHRLSGGLSPAELSAWARGALAFANAEGPTIFASEEEMLLDVLKRCAVERDPAFELSESDLRTLLRRVAYSASPSGSRGSAEGPFLVAFRARFVPARFFPIVGLCAGCGSPVRISSAMLAKARQARGALACLWCARRVPGTLAAAL